MSKMITGRGGNTTYQQRVRMLEWLEMPPGHNFMLITGQAQKNLNSVVAGAKLKKKDAYDEMADYINQQCCTNWTSKDTKSRFESYLKTYKETKRKLLDSGYEKFIVGPKDLEKRC